MHAGDLDAAGVPPGNVYYYFKTRDELVQSVTDGRSDGLVQLLDSAAESCLGQWRVQNA